MIEQLPHVAKSYTTNLDADSDSAILTEMFRPCTTFLGYALLDTNRECSTTEFNFLMSLSIEPADDGYRRITVGLACPFRRFIRTFDELYESYFDVSDDVYLARAANYPQDLKIKISYKTGTLQPYRITLNNPKQVTVRNLEQDSYRIDFPMTSSELLIQLSAIANGKKMQQDERGAFATTPNETRFFSYRNSENRHYVNLDDFFVDSSSPENWTYNPQTTNAR